MGDSQLRPSDAPPPPYSETDIYSNSAGPRSPNPASSHGLTPEDSASRHSSSNGEVIYTPPLSPSVQQPTPPLGQQPEHTPSGLTSDASFFFEARPPPAQLPPGDSVVCTIDLRNDSRHEDFSYSPNWAARDVNDQDWATFLNYLLPDHTMRGNEAVMERKLRAESMSEVRDADVNSNSTRPHAEAQLGQLQDSKTSDSAEDQSQRLRGAEDTIRTWNARFFAPRGMTVRLSPEAATRGMPGGWDPAFDTAPASGPEAGPSSRGGGSRRGGGRFGNFRVDSDGIELGGGRIKVNKDGVRIGGMVFDQHGIRRSDEAGPSSGPSWSRGWGAGLAGQGHCSPGRGPDWTSFDTKGWGAGGDRGRSAGRHESGVRYRSASVSSASSVSTSSSSDSDSSIGSLPDYDEVVGSQLPLYAARLQDWTAHPEQMRTKDEVKQLKADLREAKGQPCDGAFDSAALRTQIKVLRREWRQVKRQQSRLRRDRKRERRQRRHAERLERRHMKREMKKARRDMRRNRHDGGRGRHGGPANPGAGHAGWPDMQRGHGLFGQFPSYRNGRGPGWGGRGDAQHHGLFGSQGPFGTHGPLGPRGPLGPEGPLGPQGPLGPHGPLGPQSSLASGMFNQSSLGGTPPTRTPGSWPGDHEAVDDAPLPPPGPGAASRYRAVEAAEEEMARKLAELETAGEKGDPAKAKEVEALSETLETLRVDADEAYARELASQQ